MEDPYGAYTLVKTGDSKLAGRSLKWQALNLKMSESRQGRERSGLIAEGLLREDAGDQTEFSLTLEWRQEQWPFSWSLSAGTLFRDFQPQPPYSRREVESGGVY